MAKFNLKEATALTFAFEVSPFTVSELIQHQKEDKSVLISACCLMDIKVSLDMYLALSEDNLTKFFKGIDGITNDKAAKILDATYAIWCAKEFGVKSEEFINAIEEINPKLLTGEL